jgi:hypothetical protein
MNHFRRLAALGLASGFPCMVEGAGESNKYALVAAMGNRFISVHEVRHVDSRLPPWPKRWLEVKDDGINKIVLGSLDQAVAKMHPQAERTYITVRLSNRVMDRTRTIEEGAFEAVIDALRDMPERSKWHRIVMVTPTNRIQDRDKLAPDSQGMGLLQQGLCQSDLRDCDRIDSMSGVEVETPDGSKTKMSRFVAPYYFAKVWILDPASLTVLDTEVIHEHVKLNDPGSDSLQMSEVVARRYLAERMVQQVETSTTDAVKRTELRGTVEVKEKGEVTAPR